MAQFDLQRRFLIQVGKSDLQMYVQIVGTIMHVGWNYILVVKLGQGVIGTGIAACITNAFILAGNIHVTRIQPSLSEALDVKLFNPKVFENIS